MTSSLDEYYMFRCILHDRLYFVHKLLVEFGKISFLSYDKSVFESIRRYEAQAKSISYKEEAVGMDSRQEESVQRSDR